MKALEQQLNDLLNMYQTAKDHDRKIISMRILTIKNRIYKASIK